MKTQTILQRYNDLRSTQSDRMNVPDQYEETLLKALHPLGRCSNTGLEPMPEYDDYEDMMGILIALSRVQLRLSSQLREQYSKHMHDIRDFDNQDDHEAH